MRHSNCEDERYFNDLIHTLDVHPFALLCDNKERDERIISLYFGIVWLSSRLLVSFRLSRQLFYNLFVFSLLSTPSVRPIALPEE